MRVVIRNIKTGLFCAGGGEWAAQAEQAQDFSTAARAISFAFEAKLKDVEVLLCFEDPRYNIRFPLNAQES